MNDEVALSRKCAICKVGIGEECRWRTKGVRHGRFHSYRCRPLSTGQVEVEEPEDSEEWRMRQHVALHKLHKQHDCATYPATRVRLPLIYERQLAGRE